MTNAMRHRGPDGEGVSVDRNLALGHRRLSILDLSPAGAQPMSSPDGRYWITYNGEIYNFIELAEELEAKGYKFRSSCDTEVILAAYDHWGIDCLRRFNGMWAFAIWDRESEELILARDRFGVKPLFYFQTQRRFVFASEIKALLTIQDAPRQVNSYLVKEFLHGKQIDGAEESVFSGVFRLEPGHWARVSSAGLSKRKWWETWENRVEVPSTPEAQVERFSELFADACRIRLRSDVPVSTLLSGGMDSSAIVCTIAKHRSDPDWFSGKDRLATEWQRTFTSEYPGSIMDETEYARAVLEMCGLKGVFVQPESRNLLDTIDQVTRILDTPAVSSMPAVRAVYQAVHERGLKVTLDGQGADEMLSGYSAGDFISHYLRAGNLPQAWAAARCQAGLGGNRVRPSKIIASAIYGQIRSILRASSNLGGHQPAARASSIPDRGLLCLGSADVHDRLVERDSPNGMDAPTAGLYRQFHYTSLPQILRHYDHMAMHNSVESRMPFMDWRLVTYVFSLPHRQKVWDGYNKAVLRNAMQNVVPQKITRRLLKYGFPIAFEWFNDVALQNQVRDIMRDQVFRHMDFWDSSKVAKWYEKQCQDGWNFHEMTWLFRILSTYYWYKANFKK